MYQGYIPPPKKNRRPIDEIAPKKQNKNNNQNTELTEMGVFSAVTGNQLPNQLPKRALPALFHLRCPSQSHQINCKKEYYRLSSTCGALAITPTFSPSTHTSDDSYIYQLSLVLATATLSF